ncbi:MAG: cell division protein FtsI, partial [Kibdelosporangium sp.]
MARLRVVPVLFVLVFALTASALRLVWIQGVQSDDLSRSAARQRIVRMTIPAVRGQLLDRNGLKLAFSVETRALSWSGKAVRARYAKSGVDFDKRTAEIAAHLKAVLGDRVAEPELLVKLRSNDFGYLALDVDPAQERRITERYQADIEVESRLRREYPGGAPAANVIGAATWHDNAMHGRSGLEASLDRQLAGEAGGVTVDTAEGKGGIVIPGTERDRQPAKDGADIHLTLDADLQYFVRQRLAGHAA